MRVSIYPCGAPDAAIVLSDARGLQSYWSPHEMFVLEDGGLEGWFSPPSPRVEVQNVPQHDGAFWPARSLLGPRVLTITGVHSVSSKASSLAVAALRDRLAVLAQERLTIRVEDQAGAREVEGLVTSDVRVSPLGPSTTRFTLIISCPDPLKYGPVEVFPSGVVVNRGNAATWPTLRVDGKVTRLVAQCGGQRLEWQGNATGLQIDSRFGIPTSGGIEAGTLIDDGLFQIEPGSHTVTLTVTGGGKGVVEVRPAWV